MPTIHRIGLLCLCVALDSAAAEPASDAHEFNQARQAYEESMARSRHAEAAAHANRMRALGEKLFPDDAKRIAPLYFSEGLALQRQGSADAYPLLVQALALAQTVDDQAPMELFTIEGALALAAPTAGKLLQHLRNALRWADRAGEQEAMAVAQFKLHAGVRLGTAKGMRLIDDAARVFEQAGDVEHHATAQLAIGKYYRGRGNVKKAVAQFQAALATIGQDPSERKPFHRRLMLLAHSSLVEALEHIGDRESATKHCLAIGAVTPWGGVADYEPLLRHSPVYPYEALARGEEGAVILQFTVDEQGFVREPVALETIGPGSFERHALEAVRSYRYAPRFVDGKPVPVKGVLLRMRFELQN